MAKIALSEYVGTETLGKDSKPTIYYVTGYGSTIQHFKLHMWLFILLGYRVVAFDHNPKLLDAGDPKLLTAACDDILKYIQTDNQTHKCAGLYGISLGTFVVLYIASKTDIKAVALSAGGDSFTRIISEQPRLRTISQEFKKNGYDRAGLKDAWSKYDVATQGELFKDKRLLVMVSKADDLIKYEAVIKNIDSYRQAGAFVELTNTNTLGHGQVIIRNCFRILRTAQFFSSRS